MRECTLVTSGTRTLSSGWYAVKEDVVFASDTHLTVEGDAHLILCDGATLAITNAATRYAALSVGTNATLTIYGQSAETGHLTAKGGGQAPAIGGSHIGGGCGTVVIHSGTITANAGANAAAIGGCYKNDGGSVTITGGRIAAATRQIPVADIAALPENATTNVTLVGCEPGFYYTLHDGAVLTGIVPDAANRDVLCDAEGKVVFPAVGKPSDAAGFFRVGVDATKGD